MSTFSKVKGSIQNAATYSFYVSCNVARMRARNARNVFNTFIISSDAQQDLNIYKYIFEIK